MRILFIALITIITLLAPTSALAVLKPTCTDSLQHLIDSASAETKTIRVRTDCIYREAVKIDKPLTLDGQGGAYGQGSAEIRGSDIWGDTDWIKQGDNYVSIQTVPALPNPGGICKDDVIDAPCHWPEQVFIDGAPLEQVATNSTPQSRQFSLNSSRQIILKDNPVGHTVEVTTREYWIIVPPNTQKTSVNNVTIEGFTMKHAASRAIGGAIRLTNGGPLVYNASNWTIQNNTLSDAHGSTIGIAGSGHKILNNDLFRGGDEGLSGSRLTDTLIQGNKIHDNNTEHFEIGWGAGGIKLAVAQNITFDGNEVYNNDGVGLWCDIGCQNITYKNNRVHHNTNKGIFFEISDTAHIFNNTVWENGWGFSEWGWGGGIVTAGASNADIYNNVVAWNADGIVVISQCRDPYPLPSPPPSPTDPCDLNLPWNKVQGNYIHDNKIIMTPDTKVPSNDFIIGYIRGITTIRNGTGTAVNFMFSPEAQNRGENNTYWIPQPEGSTSLLFAWNNSRNIASLFAFNATPAEEHGRYLTDDEKDVVLTNAGIPTTPCSTHPCSSSPTPSPTPTPTTANLLGYTLSEDIIQRNNSKSPETRIRPGGIDADLGGVQGGALALIYKFQDQTPGVKTIFVRFFYSNGTHGTHIDKQASLRYKPKLIVASTTTPTPSPTPRPIGYNRFTSQIDASGTPTGGFSAWTEAPVANFPGSGEMGSFSEIVYGGKFWQKIIRGNHLYYRSSAGVDAQNNPTGGFSNWTEVSLTSWPGSGDFHSFSEIVYGGKFWQKVFRGTQAYSRSTTQIDASGTPTGGFSAWSSSPCCTDLSTFPGSGTMGSFEEIVYGGKFWQKIIRGNHLYYRSSAGVDAQNNPTGGFTNWTEVSLTGTTWPGSGDFHSFSEIVYGGKFWQKVFRGN